MLSPLGNSVEESWQRALQGQSGVTRIESFDTTDFSTKIYAPLKGFNLSDHFSAKECRRMDEFCQIGIVACEEALRDAGLEKQEDGDRMGVAIGSGIGGIDTTTQAYDVLVKSGPRRVTPFFIPAAIINMVAGEVSIRFGLRGPNISIVTACTTGTHNIGHAARMIAYGDADVMVAGGTEKASSALCMAGFSSCRALSKRNDEPEKASRPWDKDRDGFVLGEGAGIIVLEEYEHARQRGAKIHAELLGFGMSADAYHITSPDESGRGAVASMTNALKDAGIAADAVDYVNAHGTSTPAGDKVEAVALKKTFADHANKLAVSSTKSMTGHLLGAAGSVEAIFSILAIRDQVAPPTINLDNPDEECDLNFVAHKAQQRVINNVLSNSFGFGGTNGSLVFGKI